MPQGTVRSALPGGGIPARFAIHEWSVSATFSADIGDSLGFSVIAIAIVVLSVLMFRRTVFGRGVASLVVFSGLFGIVAGFLPGDSDFLFDLDCSPSFS